MNKLRTNQIYTESPNNCPMIISSANMGWLCLLLIPCIMAVLFLYLPIQYFTIVTFILVVTVISLNKPEIGVYLIVPLVIIFGNSSGILYNPIQRFLEKSLVLPVFSIFLLIQWMVLFMYQCANDNPRIRIGTPLIVFFVSFLIYNIAGLYWVGNPNSYIVLLILLSNILLFSYILSICLLNSKIFEKVINVFILSGCISSCIVVYTIFVHPEYTFIEEICRRFDFLFLWTPGLSANRGYALELSNFTARTLNLTMCLIVSRLLTLTDLKKSFWLFSALVFVFFSNCLTASKGGLLSMLAVTGFIIVFNDKLKKHIIRNCVLIYSSIVLIYVVSIVFVMLFGVGEAFRQTNIDVSGNSISIATRLKYWANGFKHLSEQEGYFSGLGLGGYEYHIQGPIWPHNTYLSFFFDFGVIGILFLVLLFAYIIKNFLKLNLLTCQKTKYQQLAFVIVSGFLIIAIHALVDFYYNNSINWLYLAIVFASLRFAVDEQSEERRCTNLPSS